MKVIPSLTPEFINRNQGIKSWLPIALILLLSATLNLYQLGTESVWIDEMFSLEDAQKLNIIGIRPFYFLILRFWMLFGTSDVWLRGLSVLFGLGIVYLTYELGRRVAEEKIGAIAALLVSISPLFINHAQEIRMYALSTFLSLAGSLILFRALENPKKVWSISWIVVRFLAIITTPLNLLMLLPDTVLILWRFRQQRKILLHFASLVIVMGMVWLPSAIALKSGGTAYMGGWVTTRPKATLPFIVAELTHFTVYWPLRDLETASPILLRSYQLFTVVLVILFGIGLYRAFKKRRSSFLLWVVAWALLPAGSILVVSWVSSSLWKARYILFIAPYVLIILAAGFAQLWQWQRKITIVVALAYFLAVSGGLWHYYTTLYRENWQAIAQEITHNEKPGDVIGLYVPRTHNMRPTKGWVDDTSLARYYKGSAPMYVIENVFPTRDKMPPAEQEQLLHDLPPVNSRLWLVYWGEPVNESAIHQIFETVVGEKFKVEFRSPFTGELMLLRASPGISEKTANSRSEKR